MARGLEKVQNGYSVRGSKREASISSIALNVSLVHHTFSIFEMEFQEMQVDRNAKT